MSGRRRGRDRKEPVRSSYYRCLAASLLKRNTKSIGNFSLNRGDQLQTPTGAAEKMTGITGLSVVTTVPTAGEQRSSAVSPNCGCLFSRAGVLGEQEIESGKSLILKVGVIQSLTGIAAEGGKMVLQAEMPPGKMPLRSVNL